MISLQLWDTAGQERFQSVTKAYYRGAHGIILMYDIAQEESFVAVKTWINSIKVNFPTCLPYISLPALPFLQTPTCLPYISLPALPFLQTPTCLPYISLPALPFLQTPTCLPYISLPALPFLQTPTCLPYIALPALPFLQTSLHVTYSLCILVWANHIALICFTTTLYSATHSKL